MSSDPWAEIEAWEQQVFQAEKRKEIDDAVSVWNNGMEFSLHGTATFTPNGNASNASPCFVAIPTPKTPASPARAAPPAIVEKFRKLADAMDKVIHDKLNSATSKMRQTRRRAAIADSMAREGLELQRLQTALRVLADHHERGDFPGHKFLWLLTSKTDVDTLLRDKSLAGHADLVSLIAGKLPTVDAAKEKIRQMERALIGAKIPDFFPTPVEVIQKLVASAAIPPEGMWSHGKPVAILEPSAGKGDIADKLREWYPAAEITCVEKVFDLFAILNAKRHKGFIGDFLNLVIKPGFDRVVMNPPFHRGADMIHVRRSFSLLAPGGRLVAVMSPAYTFHQDYSAKEFRSWLNQWKWSDYALPSGSFATADSFNQTSVETRVLVIDKPGGTPW